LIGRETEIAVVRELLRHEVGANVDCPACLAGG
jgi:hypothetical protein